MLFHDLMKRFPNPADRMALLIVLWLADQAPGAALAEVEEKFGLFGREQFTRLMAEYHERINK